MVKLKKLLKKFSPQEQDLTKEIIKSLLADKIDGFDIKKLRGYGNIFRMRKSRIRIVYSKTAEDKINILKIERRSEETYRNL